MTWISLISGTYVLRVSESLSRTFKPDLIEGTFFFYLFRWWVNGFFETSQLLLLLPQLPEMGKILWLNQFVWQTPWRGQFNRLFIGLSFCLKLTPVLSRVSIWKGYMYKQPINKTNYGVMAHSLTGTGIMIEWWKRGNIMYYWSNAGIEWNDATLVNICTSDCELWAPKQIRDFRRRKRAILLIPNLLEIKGKVCNFVSQSPGPVDQMEIHFNFMKQGGKTTYWTTGDTGLNSNW